MQAPGAVHGKDESIRPADLVGAIAGEAKVPSSVIGAIKIHGIWLAGPAPA